MDELQNLADLIRQRNAVDKKIAEIICRAAEKSHIAEYIASQVFGIALEERANQKGIDGRFMVGQLRNKTVNVKWHCQGKLNLRSDPSRDPDFYLLISGEESHSASSKVRTGLLVIRKVLLFDAGGLRKAAKNGKVKVQKRGPTHVPQELRDEAEIYPKQTNQALTLCENQKDALALFDEG